MTNHGTEIWDEQHKSNETGLLIHLRYLSYMADTKINNDRFLKKIKKIDMEMENEDAETEGENSDKRRAFPNHGISWLNQELEIE